MKLVVGLGNPGKKYEQTKHNIGFMCLDFYANKANETFKFERKFNGEALKIGNTIFLKPQTFMNLSGQSLRAVMDYFTVDVEDILVIYDDLALPLGKIRLREQGSSGGHNGIKSIIEHLGTDEFKRVRIGIDSNPLIAAKDYVLGSFSKVEFETVLEAVKVTKSIIDDFVNDANFNTIMNTYN